MPEQLAETVVRLRLARKALLEIMQESDEKATVSDADAVIMGYAKVR